LTATATEGPRRAGGLRDRVRNRRQQRSGDYDAFLSYSRRDRDLAERLQRALERFAKPWNRARSLRVYRDVSSLSPQAGLWDSIVRGLERSEWFVLLASPAAAQSDWVDREVRWWLEHRSLDTLLVVVADGPVVWDDRAGDFDWERCHWAPPSLKGRFAHEPALIEVAPAGGPGDPEARLQDATGSLVSVIKGIPKDEAFADAVREHRRTIRLARAAVASLVVLLLLALGAGLVALSQRNKARDQATLAVSRQLAAVSAAQRTTNLDTSLLLAVEAVHRDSNPQTRSALLSAALASPQLVRYFDLPTKVTAVAGSANGRVIVAGLGDGRIMRWERTGEPKAVGKVHGAVSQVAVDATGETIVATDGKPLARDASTVLLHPGEPARPLTAPAGQSASAVGVSPTGRTVVVAAERAGEGSVASLLMIDGRTGAAEARHRITGGPVAVHLVVPSDEQVVLTDGIGGWTRWQLPAWRTIDRDTASFGAQQTPGEPSADGEYVTATNGAPEIPVWRTHAAPGYNEPTLTAEAPIGSPTDLALSADGRRLAVADTGVIYVARPAPPGRPHGVPPALEGNGSVDLVRFFGTGALLLAASQNKVALWDLRQPDRLAHAATVPIRTGCVACDAPRIAVSPDSTRASVVGGGSDTAALVDLRTREAEPLPSDPYVVEFAPPLWDGRTAVLPVTPWPGTTEASHAGPMPSGVRSWRAGAGSASIIETGLARAGVAASVDERGHVFLQRVADGATVRTFTPYPGLRHPDDSIDGASVDPAAHRVAMLRGHEVSVLDLSSGAVVQRLPVAGAASIAFGGGRLFVQKDDGTLDVRSGPHLTVERTLAGDPSYFLPPVPSPEGTIVARQRRNREITLVDVDTGATLATVPPNTDSAGAHVGVAFSADGSRLLTVTDKLDARAPLLLDRDLSVAALIKSACMAAAGPLSDAEWQRFVGGPSPRHPACS
jgi:hypothetical protein